MVKTIEFACSHNHGRSPLAGAFAEKVLADREVEGYSVVSSGTRVNEINSMLEGWTEIPHDEIGFTLEIALRRGLLSPSESASVIQALSKPERTTRDYLVIQRAGVKTLRTVVGEEHAYREEAFRQFGLGSPKQTHDQTIAVPDRTLWLGMGKSNTKFATQIYAGRKDPTIDTLAGYATRTPGAEFKSGFGGTLQDYLTMAEVIRHLTTQAMDRALSEL